MADYLGVGTQTIDDSGAHVMTKAHSMRYWEALPCLHECNREARAGSGEASVVGIMHQYNSGQAGEHCTQALTRSKSGALFPVGLVGLGTTNQLVWLGLETSLPQLVLASEQL